MQVLDALGYAGSVYEHTLGEEKYTFVEDVKNPKSCTVLIKGPNDHTIAQIKDAIRDGLRAVLNTLQDGKVVAGAGAFEVAAAHHLQSKIKKTVAGRCAAAVWLSQYCRCLVSDGCKRIPLVVVGRSKLGVVLQGKAGSGYVCRGAAVAAEVPG